MKVLHVPTNTGGNPQGLARAERELGLDAWATTLFQNRFMMDVDEVLWPEGMTTRQRLAKQISLVHRAVREYDVIHYNNGKTIAALPLPVDVDGRSLKSRLTLTAYRHYATALQRYELALLQRSNKPYFVTYQGSDARQAGYCLENHDVTYFSEAEGARFKSADDHIRKQINLLSKSAQKIYALNPDLLNMLPRGAEFMPYASVDMRQWQPVWHASEKPLIVHAPSRAWVKGTKYVVAAIERLRNEGFTFDFKLIENQPHDEAAQSYKAAHLVIDQLLAGWYGALSVELMALGKPVVCYLRQTDLTNIPPAMRDQLPIIQASPTTIYSVLREWLGLPLQEWHRRGQQSRKYVETWHDPLEIAARLAKDYRAAMNTTCTASNPAEIKDRADGLPNRPNRRAG